MVFCFRQGDRPLPGYTIQRGVGRGGFGEVYYATSDGGKEVALKYLRDNPQVELRGVTHCLNLKSPYLVAVHDIRQNADGDYFVVMEYVNGPSLRDLLNTEPNGLGPQKAAYFLRELGKGLAYLHDRGIVHRDLKPGNVFYEDGYVKIGDYGLSKFITASQHSGQTVSVGTVHYMAPEVGSGNYDRTIDIYALGVILYEMLLGRVPFTGATMGEVLMKHLTAQPEVEELPEPFPRVIRKALQKDPKDRYQTVEEMVSEVFAIEDLDRSVAAFEAGSLTTLAAKAAKQAAVTLAAVPAVQAGGGAGVLGTGSSNVGLNVLPPPVVNPDVTVTREGGRFGRLQEHISARVDAIAGRIDRSPVGRQVSQAAVRRRHWLEQILTALVVVCGLSWGYAVVSGKDLDHAAGAFAYTSALAVGVLMGGWLSFKRWRLSGKWSSRFVAAICAGLVVLPAHAVAENLGIRRAESWLQAILVSLLLCDWPGRFLAGRRGTVSLGSAFAVGLFGAVMGAICDTNDPLAIAVICAGASLAVQAIAAIWPLPGRQGQADAGSGEQDMAVAVDAANWTDAASPGAAVDSPVHVRRAAAVPLAPPPVLPAIEGQTELAGLASRVRDRRGYVIRGLWLLVAAALLCTSVMLFVASGVLSLSEDDFAAYIMGGVATSSYFLFAMCCALRRYKAGLWRTLLRPLLFFSGIAACGCAGVAMGLLPMNNDEQMVAIAAIVAGAIVGLFVWFVPVPVYVPRATSPLDEVVLRRRRIGGRLMIVGGVFLGVTAVTAVGLLASVPERDLDRVMPPAVAPLAMAGVGLLSGGWVVRLSGRRTQRREVRTLPLRRVFDVDTGSDLASRIERHLTLLGYVLVGKSDLLWLFVRGEWLSHFWDKDIHHWRTRLNVAAYELSRGGHRLTCYLDVDAPFRTPHEGMIAALDVELHELQQLLGGRDVPPAAPEGV
jgi:hypothetical protein